MVVVTHKDAVSAGAADHLRRLLRTEDAYRSRWQAHVRRDTGRGALPQTAIASVLADYLQRTGELPTTREMPPRTLKEGVARALGGRLTQQFLEHFIAAFEISRLHQDQLWCSFARDRGGAAGARVEPPRPLDATDHRSVSLDELHVLGADGWPHTHRTVHVIRAVRPMDRYTYRFDPTAVAIDVVRGGRPGVAYRSGQPGTWAVDFHFHDVLPPGQTAVLEHRTVFRYDRPPPPEFRRVISGTVGTMGLEVQFHPARVPVDVWWGSWEIQDGRPRLTVPWRIGDNGAVHWSGEHVHDQVVGFQWRW